MVKYYKCGLSNDVEKSIWANNKIELKKLQLNTLPNSCPDNYAYAGNLTCREVICRDHVLNKTGNDPYLGGKMWGCKKQIIFRQELDWGPDTKQLKHDKLCPSKIPSIGWQSSCHERDYKNK